MIPTGWNGSNRKTTGSRVSLFNTKPTWTCLGMSLRNRDDSDKKSPEPWHGNIIIIITIIIIFVISFMEGIHIDTPETNLVSMVVFQLSCIYNLYHIHYYFVCQMFCTFTLLLSEVCVLAQYGCFFLVPWFSAFPVWCSGNVWMILRWFLLPLLLLVLRLLLSVTCAENILWCLYTLDSSRPRS
jgi:hypothetical protein